MGPNNHNNNICFILGISMHSETFYTKNQQQLIASFSVLLPKIFSSILHTLIFFLCPYINIDDGIMF